MSRRDIVAAWLGERAGFVVLNEATLAGFALEADDLLARLDAMQWWTVTDVAEYLGVQTATVSSYRGRGQMPAPELTYGRTHLWQPATIRQWEAKMKSRRARS